MAKGKSPGDSSRKVVFGKRKSGKAFKGKGPKDKNTSKYVGQGR